MPERDRLEAVVFDANAYGMARPDLEQLKRLASRLAGIGIETWIPEPVAWEWAEHVSRDWETVKNAARQERDRMNRAGIPVPVPTPTYDSREAVIDAVLDNLSAIPHTRIISLTGSSAVEGLKDQVLQRKPAKTKGGTPEKPGSAVKTGASDSAWLRDVLNLASPEKLLIIGADKDVDAAFREWNKPMPLIRTLDKVRPTLFDVTVDDGHAQAAIARHLLRQLPADTLDSDGTGFDIGHITGLETAITSKTDGDGSSLSVYGASVTRLVALAGVGEVSISDDAPDNSAPTKPTHGQRPGDLGLADQVVAYATAYFLAEGEATVQTLYNGGDPEVSVLHYDNVLVRAELSFHFTDGSITAVEAEAEAEATIVKSAFDDDSDALHRLDEALSCVPGLELAVAPLLYSESEASVQIHGAPARVTGTLTPRDSAWELDLVLEHGGADGGLDLLQVTCDYDPDSWWGSARDGFQGPDAYQVAVSSSDGSHGLWAVPAWLISRIAWDDFEAPVPSEEPDAEDGD
ncbi:hypothetical protein [Streptomyces sp. H23]|uniref:hypothetical protein n=1 Tax=Streptomyces sp. H23 TaxID=2541723 RepID=UPI00106DF781|nr:hypothetical protein [Streptomyces sp. H23]